jgi:S-adenosylmethionine:tRNA ribosyltransferase-isomerase
MFRSDLLFERPDRLAAVAPPEQRGLDRDSVRMLVSTREGVQHARFYELPAFLQPGDLLVYNASATLPASLESEASLGRFTLNLSTHYGSNLWLAEPRWSADKPGPLPLNAGERIKSAGLDGRLVSPFPGLPRLWFVQFAADVAPVMNRFGRPIHYGYIQDPPGLQAYQTIFARTPGSAEMPSAARPFTESVLAGLDQRGVRLAPIVLHTGVSSLEVETERVEEHPLYPEPFEVPPETARLVNETRENNRRVVAIGTTVVRALETAWNGKHLRPAVGFTSLFVTPGRGIHAVDGLLTGLHDPVTSHLAMLYAVAGQERIRQAYQEAVDEGYLWHEFGDVHLILA